MNFAEAGFCLIVGLALASYFSGGFPILGASGVFLDYLAIIFLFALAGGLWLGHWGPAVKGFYWAPFLLSNLVISIFFAIGLKRFLHTKSESVQEQDEKLVATGVFWVFVCALSLLIIGHHVYHRFWFR